jgi:hypothetical protein
MRESDAKAAVTAAMNEKPLDRVAVEEWTCIIKKKPNILMHFCVDAT